MQTSYLKMQRIAALARLYPEIKDPDLVRLPDGTFMMLASIGRSDIQSWVVGRFTAESIDGEWLEQEPVRFHGLSGPQLCASSTLCRVKNGRPQWDMHIQTACFEPNGKIVSAQSDDGLNFVQSARPAVTKESLINDRGVVGVYDAGVTEIFDEGETKECMVFSGYRSVGNGDLYASFRDPSHPDNPWQPAKLILDQESVPFHNHPEYEYREWGLEGAKLVQLGESDYLLVGVCFLPRPREFSGTRQRIFFAWGQSPSPPFTLLGTVIEPDTTGETGHPDVMLQDGVLHMIYQERTGEGKPWHLRYTRFDVERLREEMTRKRTTDLSSAYWTVGSHDHAANDYRFRL
ncbi:MAG: hypothetical protein M3N08_09360 [Pseudomonadota bacterium]|nr:hypothetical protein [Pseudomonadota bacterium]